MDSVSDGRSDGSRDEAGSWVWGSVHGKEYFWEGGANLGCVIVTNGDFAERHGPVPKLLWADLLNASDFCVSSSRQSDDTESVT